jgi:proteasome inhibitor subunit 1 (PI31)
MKGSTWALVRTRSLLIEIKDEKTASLDVLTADYLSASFFPYNPSSSESPLVHGFISSSRVKDFITLYKINILQKLVPGLRKDGYQEERYSNDCLVRVSLMLMNSFRSTVPTTAASTSNPPPSQPPARLPSPPFSMHEPFHHPYPARNPLSVGRSDLDPLGGMGVFNPPPLSGGHGGDGMFVGPEHPLFRDRFATPGGGRRWGGDGWLPPMGAPPGARFDPIGPGMGPLGGGLPGNPGQPPRRPPGSGGPDNDEFMPPGMVRSNSFA